MLDKELLKKINQLIKKDNNNQYINEEDLNFLYGDVNLISKVIEFLDENNIAIKKVHKENIANKVLEYQKEKSIKLRDELFEECLYYIYKVSFVMHKKYNISMDILTGYGYEGFIYAIDNYDAGKSDKVINYIRQNIYYSIASFIDKSYNNDDKLLPYEGLNLGNSYDIDDFIDSFADKEIIEKSLSELPIMTRRIVELYYGFNEDKEHTLNEVAEKLGITVEMVRTRMRKALIKIKFDYYLAKKDVRKNKK